MSEKYENLRTRTIGVLSDTHGRLPQCAIEALEGCDYIVHAGDIGDHGILRRLEQIAPIVAVRGNMDRSPWAMDLPSAEIVEFGDITAYVLHDVLKLDIDPLAAGVNVVISGHEHRASIRMDRGVCYVNPGSVGQPRGQQAGTLALLHVRGDTVDAAIVELHC